MEIAAKMFIIVILITIVSYISTREIYVLNGRSCVPIINRDFVIHELNCRYVGPRDYRFGGTSTVKVLKIDRLMDSTLEIPVKAKLERIYVIDGVVCPHVNAPVNVKIYLAGILCNDDSTTKPISVVTAERERGTDDHTFSSDTTTARPTTSNAEETTKNDVFTTRTVSVGITQERNSRQTDDHTTSSGTIISRPTTTNANDITPSETTKDQETTPWIVSTAILIADYIEIIVLSLVTVAISYRRLITALTPVFDEIRLVFPILIPAPPHQIPAQPPQPQIELQPNPRPVEHQQPLRRSNRIRRRPNRLTL